jgi:hypothetical protein
VTKAVLPDLSLALQLLLDNLVVAVVFRRLDSSEPIEFRVATENQSHIEGGNGRLAVYLAASDLDFVRHFFLRYYRDGFADVDHIDIQNSDGGYTTFYAEQSVPPVSAEEAKRLLGME